MAVSERKIKDLEVRLSNKNPKMVSEAIVSLRKEKHFTGAIGLLAGLFDSTSNLVIRDLIQGFLNDVKEPVARIEVIKEIRKNYKPETTCMLVSSCWQSGLDYSEYSLDFANTFIRGDYLTALECFTVIEESLPGITQTDRSWITGLLEQNRENSSAEKNALTTALIKILK